MADTPMSEDPPASSRLLESRVDTVITETSLEMESLPVGSAEEGTAANYSQRGRCGSCLRRIHYEKNPLPENARFPHRLKYSLLCPPHGAIGKVLTWTILAVLMWVSLVSVLGETALLKGNIFSLYILFVVAILGGMAVEPLRLPPLLGMLLVGILLSSVPGINIIGRSIDPDWSSALRNIALVVILLRAGLGLDPAAMKALSLMVLRLAFCPCIVETIVVAIVTHLLMGFPWLWGLMLGFILSAVTPAVIVPCMLKISEEKWGVEKGIPTLVIAASSVDDVLALSGFGIVMGLTFAGGSIGWTIAKAPIEVLVGVVSGCALGALCWILPNRKQEKNCILLRFAILFSAGIVSIFGSQMVNLSGAGALGCLVMAFVAGIGWRRQRGNDENDPVDDYLNGVWIVFEPLLFSLIGTEIKVSEVDPNTVGWGLITIAIGLVFRMATSFLVVMGGDLNVKERIFVAFAWLPKATVQAAIGSTALVYARSYLGPEEVRLGEQVLTIAVLVILITAPLGAAAIMISAPKLLSKPSNMPNGKAPEEVDMAAEENSAFETKT